ncbi:hypothetical protein ACSDQ9_13150 [Aestuariimicrobium soli]|uniref:hypothetical protein n=1 Tax=Aestuariimicrobium soli TaxID=2035834 RepID=UPI003EC05A47
MMNNPVWKTVAAALAVATAVSVSSCAQLGVGGGGDSGAAPDAATLKERVVKAADGAPVLFGSFYGNGTSGGGWVSVLKGSAAERRMLDGSDTSSSDEGWAAGSMAADAVPYDQVAKAREGVTCQTQGGVTVTFQVTPAGKPWFQSECDQETQTQLLDGKAVPELSDPTSAATLTTLLEEQKATTGLTQFTEIVISVADTELGPTATFAGPGKHAGGECNLSMTRRFTVKGVSEGGVGRPGCETAKGTAYSLDGASGESLATAIAAGVKLAGGFKAATIHAGSNGQPVIDVLSDKQGGLARVDLQGKPVT